MRQLYALMLGTALSAPSLALAATPPDIGHHPVAKAAATSGVASTSDVTSSNALQVAPKHQEAKQGDRARYASKEAQSGDAKNYRGGDTLVIGASAAVAILAVLLVIVLI